MSYALTADGRELASALRLLADWGARRPATREPLRHATCGTPLEARWFCPTCETLVDAPDRRRGPDRLASPTGPGYTRWRDHGRRTLGARHAGARPPGRARRRPSTVSNLPPSLQGLPPRSVPEVAPTPLQKHYINLSAVVLICGAIAITALSSAPGSATR